MRVLITCGPTREYIDEVRFISNASSGSIGWALANEAIWRGHEVTVVLGPCGPPKSPRAKVIPVVSSQEMADATLGELSRGYDLMISAAAIGDWVPTKRVSGKISSAKGLTLRLKPARKLIREARKSFPALKIVAFKAEWGKTEEELIEAARGLLQYADLVVANDISRYGFGSPTTELFIVSDRVRHVKPATKEEAAKAIFDSLS
jgi:phosphopantothenoylcysteine decarboxylase / phosphopantothenate---cysteine ligase